MAAEGRAMKRTSFCTLALSIPDSNFALSEHEETLNIAVGFFGVGGRGVMHLNIGSKAAPAKVDTLTK